MVGGGSDKHLIVNFSNLKDFDIIKQRIIFTKLKGGFYNIIIGLENCFNYWNRSGNCFWRLFWFSVGFTKG